MEKIIKKYNVDKVLGKGSFAEVFLARRVSDGHQFAIKQVRKIDEKKTVKNDIECEIMKLMMKKPHPNIIQLEEIQEDKHNIYIVQEYAAGGDLLSFLQTHQLSEDELKKLMKSILSAVSHLHSLGIVHRDIKLENILLDQERNPKIADFGLSCYWNPLQKIESFCGSPMYCAPELIARRPYRGPEVDVWACGVVFYACAWNCFPFALDKTNPNQSEALKTMLRSVIESDVVLPSAKGHMGARGIIKAMLVRDKDFRTTLNEVSLHSWLNETDDSSKKDCSKKYQNRSHNWSTTRVKYQMKNMWHHVHSAIDN